ncbi:MAG: ImmA/IrrE family metallo-endopeptidase [Hamadaea sp.]|nr:ImmA/IrrE family metallo-endopeptidase [Hamadaea sp.]
MKTTGSDRALFYDPGADAARRHPDWVIRHRDLRGVPEVMCPERKVILIEDAQDRATRRCNLAHALAHIDLGHQAQTGVLSKRQELAADKLAARRLVRASALAEAAISAESFEELAHELDVDERMLWVRIKYLQRKERNLIFERLDEKVLTA